MTENADETGDEPARLTHAETGVDIEASEDATAGFSRTVSSGSTRGSRSVRRLTHQRNTHFASG